MKPALTVIALITTLSGSAWANFAHLEINASNGVQTFRAAINQPLTKNFGIEGSLETTKGWTQWYAGPSLSTPNTHIFVGLGADSNRNTRAGTCLWTTITKNVSLLVLANGGRSGKWDKEELCFSINPELSILAVHDSCKGVGGGLSYQLNKNYQLKTTVLTKDKDKTILMVSQFNW